MSLLMILSLSCQKDAAEDTVGPQRPDLVCPGDLGCEDADGPLQAGAAAVSITPQCFETWSDLDGDRRYKVSKDEYEDCGCDRLCAGDPGYPGPDEGEGDGSFLAMWMGGFSVGHPAQGVHDELWARSLVMERGSTRIALVSVDLVGFFNEDVTKVREALEAEDLQVDHLLISATHTHEGPDTMGLWGKAIGKSGYQEFYLEQVREGITESVRQAVGELRPVGEAKLGAVRASDYHPDGIANVIRDTRDPVVIPQEVGSLWLKDQDGETIATVVHWACHPETLGDDNLLISSDFVDSLRQTVEQGSNWEAYQSEGLGGVAIYMQGMVGGMMTTLRMDVETPDGDIHSDAGFPKTEAVGTLLGEMAVEAAQGGEVLDPDALLSVRAQGVKLPVVNTAFTALFLIGTLPRTLYDYDPAQPANSDNRPMVLTEINLIRLGPLSMLTMPGEILPEAVLGGYDGSLTGTPLYDLVQADNPNPPALDLAPLPPYLVEEIPGTQRWVIGLGNDELGYIIPSYNFETHPETPYLDEADGHHYEETNSLGPDTEPILIGAAKALLSWSP